MEILNYIIIATGIFSLLILLFFALRTGKFFKTVLTSAAIGISILLILHFTSSFTNFSVELTPFTIGASGILGLPGVICIVICKMIFLV